MPGTWSIRLQTAVVVALFLGSLAAVLFNTFQTVYLPQGEQEIKERLREASRRMADKAEPDLANRKDGEGNTFERLNARLHRMTDQILRDFPGVEGGFYLSDSIARFAGYGFPTERPKPPPPPPGSPAPPPKLRSGDDPPPKEGPIILSQVEESLSLGPGKYSCIVQTMGPSRVAILTEPVGSERPARAATWTMFRLLNPESLERQLRRYQISTGLALGGIALAVVLTGNLGRSLKRQRREQEHLRDELRRAEHLAALGKLLAGVAHEVRNPLAGIRSTVQLWERLPDTARTQGSLQAVIQAVDRLNEIVSRLLYFSRADRAERQPVSINNLLAETLRLLEAQAAAQAVSLEMSFEPDLPAVLGSASALRQVFLNLATNALQAMPRGGRLQCSSRWQGHDHRIEIDFADTGPGISPQDQQHLFEPFFTTRPDGTGLGLALCREIVLQHGGQIELAAGHPGTTFRVIFPVAHCGSALGVHHG